MTDTQFFTTKETPEKERRHVGVGDIYQNQVKCLKCNDVIRSKNRHDFVTCSCGAISVDGGSWYLKRVGDLDAYEEQSENYTDAN